MDELLNTDDSIENKKKDKKDGGMRLKWKKFAITFFGNFLITICFFTVVIGACGLYTAKVAQSNILPTNQQFAPYTSEDYKMGTNDEGKVSSVLMNIVKGRSWKGFNFFDEPTSINAQNATFIKENFDDNGVFSFFCKIKPFSEQNENFSRMTFFFRKLFINGILSSFDMVNTIYSFLYSFPEWLLMLVYFTIFPLIFIFLICWNAFKIFLEAISNIIIPFRVNNPKDGTDRDSAGINFKHMDTDTDDPTSQWWRKWTECENKKYAELHKGIWGTITEFMDYIGYGVMFMIYAMITFNVFIPISLFVTFFSLFNPLLRKYTLQGENATKKNGFGDFLRDTFAYKKTFIIFLAAYNLLISTGLFLGNGYTFSCIVGLLILTLYFEVFSTPDSTKIFIDDSTQIIVKNGQLPEFIRVEQETQGPNTFKKCQDKVVIQVKPKPLNVEPTETKPLEDKRVLLPKKNPGDNDAHQQIVFSNSHILKTRDPKKKFEKLDNKSKGNLIPQLNENNKQQFQQATFNPVPVKPEIPVPPTTTATTPSFQQAKFKPTTTSTVGAKRTKGGALYNKYNFSLI